MVVVFGASGVVVIFGGVVGAKTGLDKSESDVSQRSTSIMCDGVEGGMGRRGNELVGGVKREPERRLEPSPSLTLVELDIDMGLLASCLDIGMGVMWGLRKCGGVAKG